MYLSTRTRDGDALSHGGHQIYDSPRIQTVIILTLQFSLPVVSACLFFRTRLELGPEIKPVNPSLLLGYPKLLRRVILFSSRRRLNSLSAQLIRTVNLSCLGLDIVDWPIIRLDSSRRLNVLAAYLFNQGYPIPRELDRSIGLPIFVTY